MNRIALLGSTGSVGTQTLSVVRALRDRVEVVALAGGHNSALLSRQLAEFRPRLFHSLNAEQVESAGATLTSLERIACDDGVDTVVVATSGSAGLIPTLAALRNGKKVALASKEVLVMAGRLVNETARTSGGTLVPIDSEHSAIWQCLQGERNSVSRLLLTASGGPFLTSTHEQTSRVTAGEALAHPVWRMGSKISIDSATLMNKGLEVIEAHWLFNVQYERIEVVIHPECLVHSMVEFVDGSVKAQMSTPDMSLPIQYALTHPERVPGLTQHISWGLPRLFSFQPVPPDRFPCLTLAREAGCAGGTYPAALCGADEAAVSLFLQGAIRLTDIPRVVESALSAHHPPGGDDLDDVVEAHETAHQYVMAYRSAGTAGSESRLKRA